MARLGIPGGWMILMAAIAAAGCSKNEQPPQAQQATQAPAQYDAEAFFATTSFGLAGGFAWSPDDKDLLVHADETGIFNAYALPASGRCGSNLARGT